MLNRDQHPKILRRGDYVGGSFVKPAVLTSRFQVVNPSDTQDILATVEASTHSVDESVRAAGAGAAQWRNTPLTERVNALKQLRTRLLADADVFCALLTRETGALKKDAHVEVQASARAIDLLIESAPRQLVPVEVSPETARSDRHARGVVAIITPRQSALLVTAFQVTAALLGGNAVVHKPSTGAALIAQRFTQLIDSLGLPRGTFNMVQGSGPTIGHRLVTSHHIHALLFTGQYQNAVKIQQALVGRPELPVFFDTVGKGAAIITPECDLQQAVHETLTGMTAQAGQNHHGIGRAFVVREHFSKFLAAIIEQAQALRVGPANQPTTQIGPLSSNQAVQDHQDFKRIVTDAGHTVSIPPTPVMVPNMSGHYVRPALYVIDWENGDGLFDTSPPGPSLLIYQVATTAEAISLFNQCRHRPNAAVFTHNPPTNIRDTVRALKAGAINVNRNATSGSLRLPSTPHGCVSNGFHSGINLLGALTTPRAMLVDTRPANF